MVNLLIDLDGTLTDTTSDDFRELRDSRNYQFNPQNIPLIEGALDFVQHVKTLGHSVAIISDSQPNYVERMAAEIFDVPCVSLTDKPNTGKIREFLLERFKFSDNSNVEDFLFIGDRDLDISTARRLEIPSVFLGSAFDLKFGATYYCENYQDVRKVLENLAANRFVLEDTAGQQTAVFLHELNRNNGYTTICSLARQHRGACDKFGALKRYNSFGDRNRNAEFVSEIAKDVSVYLCNTVCVNPWDYITYVPDKKSTKPPRKMEEFLSALNAPIPKAKLFSWSPDVEDSTRKQGAKDYRLGFVDSSISLQEEHSLKDKNVIVFDDNYSTGATAEKLSEKLLDAGVQNVLFICLFYLTDDVPSERFCPQCNRRLKIKYRGYDGKRFLSCATFRYGGNGCGWTGPIT